MFLKSVLLILAVGSIEATFFDQQDRDKCVVPHLTHGRVRLRQRSRLARFTCLLRYELVGNKYATCRDGQWDVPLPVCVRPACPIPQLQNGLSMLSHGGAWVIFFCFPNHELVGSPVIYCDGYKWNATAPKCIDTTVPPKLSCDFEDPDLCGWKQDALHDFDWIRLNSKTPSSIFFTGPSFDHTLGMGKNGYFMYIESTSHVENDTARLISPVYDHSLAQDGCFSFSYHMFGKTCGGLRVYQKPENITLRAILELPDQKKQTYLLFEKWGNLGNTWFDAVSTLRNFSTDFQIVIEGIRGSSYTSDIAIDDVAILQGASCAIVALSATTPAAPTTTEASDSCVNRCIDDYVTKPATDDRCSCSYACFLEEVCCPDFFAVCLYDTTEIDLNNSLARTVSEEAPQTLKLVAGTIESTSTTARTTTTSSTSPMPTTQRRTTTVRSKPITTPKPKITTVKSTSPTTTSTLSSTRAKTTTRKVTTTNKPSPTFRPTSPKPTAYSRTTTTKSTPVAAKVKTLTTTVSTTKVTTTKVTATTSYKTPIRIVNDNYLDSVEKAKEKEDIENRDGDVKNKKVFHEEVKVLPQGGMSSSGKVVLIILVLVTLSAAAMMVHVSLRSTRLRIALARFRGNRNRDPEVRYLSSDVDE